MQQIIQLNAQISRVLLKGRSESTLNAKLSSLGMTPKEIQHVIQNPLYVPAKQLIRVLEHLRLYELIFEICCMNIKGSVLFSPDKNIH